MTKPRDASASSMRRRATGATDGRTRRALPAPMNGDARKRHALPLAPALFACFFGWGCEPPQKPEDSSPPHTASSFGSPFAKRTEPNPPPHGSEGPSHDDPDFFLTAEAPRRCPESPPFLPPVGYERLSIALRIQAKTGRLVPIGPLAFSLEDEGGRRFGATLAGCGPSLPRRDLQAPADAYGELAFDVPRDARGLRLVFEPFLIGRSPTKVWLDLPTSEGAPASSNPKEDPASARAK